MNIREFANNISQTPLAKIRNIINQCGRKPFGGGEFCLRTAFELLFLQAFLINKLGVIQVNKDKYPGFNHPQD